MFSASIFIFPALIPVTRFLVISQVLIYPRLSSSPFSRDDNSHVKRNSLYIQVQALIGLCLEYFRSLDKRAQIRTYVTPVCFTNNLCRPITHLLVDLLIAL